MYQYNKYKESNIEWIGEVPYTWNKCRIKFLFSRSSAGIWGENEKNDENDVVCFRVADFDYVHGCLKFNDLTVRNIQQKKLKSRILHEGDLLIEKSGGGESTPVGRVVRYNYEGKATCSNFINFISIKGSTNNDYIYYYFYAMYANGVNKLYFNQTTGIQNLKISEYFSQTIYLPTYLEQQSISKYLDKRCCKIDKSIAHLQKQIDLFMELRKVIIKNAVTHGISSNYKLKDSGVAWIGKIPEHWNVVKTSLLFNNIGSGTTPSTSKKEYYTEDGYFWLQTGDLNDGYITDTSKKITKKAIKECRLKYYPVNSVVIAMYGATIGKVGILQIPTATNQACCVLPPSVKMNELYTFFLYQIAKIPMLLNAVGGGQPNISQDIIKKLKVPVPPLSEQCHIAKYIKEKCIRIDSSVLVQRKRIELLQELKQTIITEAVTGKIKVL